MSNKPEPSEFYILEDDEKKVEYEKDEKLTNCGIFAIRKEDHTIGNITRAHLLRNKKVLFAGYRIHHPLIAEIKFKVRTTADSSPPAAMNKALNDSMKECRKLKKTFNEAVHTFKQAQLGRGEEL
ncbi:hypothetical protein AAMO2058_000573000 [Amorphochlora amoebiformis]